ncbi:MAG: hypothetical protein QW666_03045 [Candidatus Woesearchaeota archaeon]
MPNELTAILANIEMSSDYFGELCPLVLTVNSKRNYEQAKQLIKAYETEFGIIPQYPLFFPDIHIYGTQAQAKNLASALFGTDIKYALLRKYFKKNIAVFSEPTVVCSL